MSALVNDIQQLKDEFQEADCVWFLVDVKYRILAFNKKAAENSLAFHNREIAPGQSILDYARDTRNQVDTEFIHCFGKAAAGQRVEFEQHIVYNTASIIAKSVYTPALQEHNTKGVSITVHYTPVTTEVPV